jgi:large subunit ribosomal protein L10
MSVIIKKIGSLYRDMVSLELKRRLSECSDVFLINYQKIKSAEMTLLRKNLKSSGANILVTKNSFMRKVLEESRKPSPAISMVDGPMALVFVKSDPIAASKVLVNFLKDHEALQIKGGFLAERVISLDDIKLIAKLTSKQALHQQVACVLQAPVSKLAMTLNQIVTKLAYVLKAVSDKKQ